VVTSHTAASRARWIGAFAAALISLGAARGEAEPINWATTQAAELTRQGRAHVGQGDVMTARRRYLDAIGFDPTYGPAYLALGELHESVGDPKEAERAYSMGIDHVVDFTEARLSRAHLYLRQQRRDDAIVDLEAAARQRPDDVAILRELSSAYVASSLLPAALSVTRRIVALLDANRDARAAAEARVATRALAALVADADPVTAGISQRGEVRRALALLAKGRDRKTRTR
jgi:tetratricopeptide (TPR) repeat protein